jgi:hypothetical protein
MASFRSHEQRDLFALSFEPSGEGYHYYHYRWSRGVPVTAAERDAYLNIPIFGSRRAWRKSLIGRETLPPRSYASVRQKLLAAMPYRMAFGGVIVGAVGLVSGLSERDTAIKIVYLVAGAVMLIFGVSILVARFMQSRATVR